jgi:membrane-associated phospholipid phosphatase
MSKRALKFVLAAAALAGCNPDSPTSPEVGEAPAFAAVKFWEAGATVAWNERATGLAASQPAALPLDVGRLYLYLSLAQLRAAEAAAESPGPHPPTSAAIGAASAAILNAFFPAKTAEIEAALDAQAAATPWPGGKHQDFAAGEAIGRAVAARVLTYAAADRIGLTNPGTPPIGPGFWLWTGGPIARSGLGARPVFLSTGSEFRPAPPPAYGSAEFVSALAEVRHIADTRTAEQIAIANYWNVNQSPRSEAAMMALARELIVSHRRSDAEAARILFLMSGAAFDAIIGCFDAKYHYWFLRPVHADPGIVTVFPTPPHPSYPSAHSCVSGALTGVLAEVFPSERGRVEALAEEASLSRLYAGIHYRFDMVAGLELGRDVAAKAMDADLSAVAVQ